MTFTIDATEDNRPSLLLVDDDLTFCQVLSQALIKRGFAVRLAHSVDEALCLVEDDATHRDVLVPQEGRSNASRVRDSRPSIDSAGCREWPPEYAVIDLRMPGPSGLVLVEKLKTLDSHTRIVVLTGYASIATAVEAIKLGATHYLTKPADADEIVQAFHCETGEASMAIAENPLSVDRLEWEHIQKVLLECQGNISATARRLDMHRRTLQRKLNKRPARR
ncbi:MAG: response regulator transcription factor [Gammaproteobacteria bacterium]